MIHRVPVIRCPENSKSIVNREKDNGTTIYRRDVNDKFLKVIVFLIVIQVSCQYHFWFWSYDNFYS